MARYSPQLDAHIDELLRRYFSDPERRIFLRAGELLVAQGQKNHRLYFVRSGLVRGTVVNDQGEEEEFMRCGAGDLVGVRSFFTGERVSQTLRAWEDTELAWIASSQDKDEQLEQELMPMVVAELVRRQRLIHEMGKAEAATRERLKELQRLSHLGQLAAGVAHELNNVLAVISRGSEWLGGALYKQFSSIDPTQYAAFQEGLNQGRSFSTREIRERSQFLADKFSLPRLVAQSLARSGLSDQQLQEAGNICKNADEIAESWEIGATLHDLRIASVQAEHVVQSMRALGAQGMHQPEPVDVVAHLCHALQLLDHDLQGILVERDFAVDLPRVMAGPGSLMQVWINIIRNACQALQRQPPAVSEKTIHISAQPSPGGVSVIVSDNGPGIDSEIIARIFEPSVSTRKQGLSFGLGLGMSIVQRLVTDMGGSVEAENIRSGARIRVILPGVHDEAEADYSLR